MLQTNVNLVSLVESFGIELKQNGSRYVGVCPFHDEDTASFYVFDDNKFHCFGCGGHGDAIDFVRKMNGCSFKAALEYLGVERKTDKRAIKERQERLRKKREFKAWRVDATNELGLLCRVCRNMLAKIQTPDDLNLYGHLYHDLAIYDYYLDVLTDEKITDEQKDLQETLKGDEMLKSVGGLWLKDGKNGKFMSGEIEINDEKIRIMVFKNKKEKDNHPDYRIMMTIDDEPKEDPQDVVPDNEDDIPF